MTTTSRSRPLWRAALLSCLVGIAAAFFYAIFTSSLLVLLLVAGWFFYVALVVGLLMFPRPRASRCQTKVFCLGLSRTGTCSLSVALDHLGYSVYHMCFRILRFSNESSTTIRLNEKWSDAFDAQLDMPVSLVYRELAQRYPLAKFILTTRDPERWGQAVVSFLARYRRLFKYVPYPPVARTLALSYGADWDVKGAKEYSILYVDYVREVREFFAHRGESDRVLEVSICEGEDQARLLQFLGRPAQSQTFPHIDVFDLSWNRQPLWQLKNLLEYFVPGSLLRRGR